MLMHVLVCVQAQVHVCGCVCVRVDWSDPLGLLVYVCEHVCV